MFLGSRCLFAYGITIRLADPHLIYDTETYERINFSKGVFIGDHVWVGQEALILKGTQLGSGSIIGARSVVSNKKIHSNTTYAGNPAKLVRQNVFFTSDSVHNYTKEDTEASRVLKCDDYIYTKDESTLDINYIFSTLDSTYDALERIEF